ncbi:CHTF18 isoform 12, partial [Pongo abelii]
SRSTASGGSGCFRKPRGSQTPCTVSGRGRRRQHSPWGPLRRSRLTAKMPPLTASGWMSLHPSTTRSCSVMTSPTAACSSG